MYGINEVRISAALYIIYESTSPNNELSEIIILFFNNMEKIEFKNSSLEQYKELANQLDVLQKNENEGRGVSCVRAVIACLNSGDLEGAKAVCKNDGDKIESYDDIKKFLISNLFKNEKHPWIFSEKL